MKAVQLFTFLSLFFLFTLLQAQYSVSGVITDAENQPIVGANVLIEGTYFGAASDENGKYIIDQLKAGDYKLVVSSTGFSKAYQSISLTENTKVNFKLDALDLTLDEVLVSGLRANENTATTYTNMSKEELAPLNLGQDVPFVLRMTPSAVVTSDAGAGVGYTGIRIRGSDATRVNISINGVAFNDSESQGTFWVNLPDFASSVNNLQIQRGVGTSANGAGAFGASVNIQTTGLNTQAYTELNNSFG
ncbi:MAG: carboxypeptidase-like regulatory domain-containing protein, partial [Chitinophagales bacterium]